MFVSLTAQKLSYDLEALEALNKKCPAGVDFNLFQDTGKRVLGRLAKRIATAGKVDGRAVNILLNQAEHATKERRKLIVARAQLRRERAEQVCVI